MLADGSGTQLQMTSLPLTPNGQKSQGIQAKPVSRAFDGEKLALMVEGGHFNVGKIILIQDENIQEG